MAKRQKGRKKKQTNNWFKRKEVVAVLFLFLAVFGSGASAISDGAIPALLENIFRMIFGVWYFVASVLFLILGLYLLIKRKWPNMRNKYWVSSYLIFIGILLITHIELFEANFNSNDYPSIVNQSWTYYSDYLNMMVPADYLGGGMVGAFLYASGYYLFSAIGSKILAFFMIILGIILSTNFSTSKFFSKIINWLKGKWSKSLKKWKSNRKERANKKEELVVIEQDEPQTDLENDPDQTYPAIAYANDKSQSEEKNLTDEPNNQVPQDETQDEVVKNEKDEVLPMTELENIDYKLPPMDILQAPKKNTQQQERSQIQAVVRKLEKTFHSFGVKAKVTKVHVGPAVTKYEVYPEAGVKVSKIVNLHDDLALALAAKDIRIEAPIPGKSAVGIEVPNQEVAMVSLREVLESKKMNKGSLLSFVLGRDISGEAIMAELNKMPHLLVAGATGSGKSVCINGIITSILMRTKPHEVKMMMIDPKKVELNVYNGIPHLLAPVVTDPKKASRALKKVVAEMERRYELFSETGTRNIEGYNELINKTNQQNEDEEEQPSLPYIVVIVDELADLMMVASNDVEDAITRLAQMARAAGIHLIIATQRPSVDVITGVIKANIPSRIAFSVSSATDSRTILDSGGAEKLLGRGDMLFIPVGMSKPIRVQGAFLSDTEVEDIVDYCIEQQKAQYQTEMIPEEESETHSEVDDDLFDDAVQLVTEMQSASVSMLQRRFRVGYTRAARLIDAMEDRGIVGPYEGSKPRTVLVSSYSEEATET
ncbi:DNA translocase FtsK [Saliterribacillus persicus]|uniref:DNA translocase FtsK n=1 Tax=Saliterribacillus persicus TaxID=930114 RepID=A0A368XUE3_9BACI|nr:DNA translocase FtsK [Saliterribacillus persicus]RCW70658.1 DNA translocase FtsK [Saliterribacillus persicus]